MAPFHNWKSKLKAKRGDIWPGTNNTGLVIVLGFSGDEFIGSLHQSDAKTPEQTSDTAGED